MWRSDGLSILPQYCNDYEEFFIDTGRECHYLWRMRRLQGFTCIGPSRVCPPPEFTVKSNKQGTKVIAKPNTDTRIVSCKFFMGSQVLLRVNPNMKLCWSFPCFAREGANPRLTPTPLGCLLAQLYSYFPRKIFRPDKTLMGSPKAHPRPPLWWFMYVPEIDPLFQTLFTNFPWSHVGWHGKNVPEHEHQTEYVRPIEWLTPVSTRLSTVYPEIFV